MYNLNLNYTAYEPDFIIETKTGKFICEIKKEKEIEESTVQAKVRAVME
ncbi:hypothetical protein [Brevibacillus laterosporus]|nr:hypothetical protein [Brevibacillus laterosporus]MED1662763.1 hypothetical protein [Brevibacillus laterosporus]MED1669111.1 hypothetical protein [Brevibacillus laterosporus]MED1720586.1 hypothetical protein [Brevibacillus laterosporus]